MKTILCLLTAVTFSAFAADDGWRPLFNGKDLTGWIPVQVAPNTFTVRDGIIVSTGVPTGVMRTDRQYENFELELEWKHIVPKGNAGLFVWSYPITAVGQPFTKSIEVQILDGRNSETHTSHGDIFSIHGARMTPDRPHPRGAERCLPSEFRCKPAGEWNHYRVVCNNGVIKLSVNGKEVSGGSNCTPRKGYICLESESTECHFRNIRIKELPSTNPKPEETAPLADGFVSIYNGLNLAGWTSKAQSHWKAKDWTLEYDGKGSDADLWFDKPLRNFEMIVDWRVTDKDAKSGFGYLIEHRWKNSNRRQGEGSSMGAQKKPGEWVRTKIKVTQEGIRAETDGAVSGNIPGPGADETWDERRFVIQAPPNAIQIANIYIKELPEKSKPEASLPPEGFVPLDVNLDRWEIASLGAAWKVNDSILENHSGHSAIISQKKYGDYILIFDWRVPEDDAHQNAPYLYVDRGSYSPGPGGKHRNGLFFPETLLPPNLIGTWNRSRVTVEGDQCVIEINDRVVRTTNDLSGGNEAGKFGIGRDGARLDVANIYIKELK